MKAQKLMLSALCATFFAVVGCTSLEPYTIDAPDDLAEQIAAYQAEQRQKEESGEVIITKDEIPTAGFFTALSQEFVIPSGSMLQLTFVNHTPVAENWNNWNLAVAKDVDVESRTWDNFGETGYFCLRADGWVMKKIDEADGNQRVVLEYPDWDTFKTQMNEATVVLEVDHSKAGAAYVTAVATAKDGSTMTMTYNNPVSATENIRAFVFGDNSGMTITGAKMLESRVKEIPDEVATAITVTGLPASVEIGTTWAEVLEKELVATVSFADESSVKVPIEDVTFKVRDNFGQAEGTESIIYAYAKTKQGNSCSPVIGTASIDVTASILSLEVSATAKVIGAAANVTLSNENVVVYGVLGNDTKIRLTEGYTISFTDDKVVYAAEVGTYADAFTVTYGELSAKGALTIAASSATVEAGVIGATDNTTGFHAVSSTRVEVAAGESQTVHFTITGSAATENYFCPVVFAYNGATEIGLFRMDNAGLLTGQNWNIGFVLDCNWNWDTYKEGMIGAVIDLTVANNGIGKASILMHVVYADGTTTYYQRFKEIPVASEAALQFEVTVDHCHLTF